MKKILAVFDFDQTLLEHNSDVEIQKLAPNGGQIPEEIHQVAKNQGWTAFVNASLAYLHENGVRKEDILNFIRQMPWVDGAVNLIKKLKNDLKADIIIISDANSIYIDESLKQQGLREYFQEIFTNPAQFGDQNGRLCVTPFTHQTDCDLSERNLCKGKVMLDFIGHKNYDFVCYAGDGGNDFCPIEKLNANDLAFVRKGYALEKKIPRMKEKRGLEVKAEIIYWTNGHEILEEIVKKANA